MYLHIYILCEYDQRILVACFCLFSFSFLCFTFSSETTNCIEFPNISNRYSQIYLLENICPTNSTLKWTYPYLPIGHGASTFPLSQHQPRSQHIPSVLETFNSEQEI